VADRGWRSGYDGCFSEGLMNFIDGDIASSW